MFRVVQRVWIPTVVVIVCAVAAFAVVRLQEVAGSTNHSTGAIRDGSEPVIPKDVIYEVFGPAGTTGQANFLDEHSQPQQANFATLPWSYRISTKLMSVFANVVAQGDSEMLGCRITVNGEVLDEQSVTAQNAQVFCLVKSA
ncbi:putative conserved membrane protein, MmpS [Mycolicibacterium litorale]|uniref:Putative conserved membrane protein, MmpS n=1 Tax=Mycolicibacterium litorale TaxID=758802 RepID=A0A6S6P0V5_9MYCO|nr:MmpS family transport accessory protein [Mycolicibacterium litorale]BCI51131.1 putative conserved membrane protein, MmpS [Mycolicibacterium litorale]